MKVATRYPQFLIAVLILSLPLHIGPVRSAPHKGYIRLSEPLIPKYDTRTRKPSYFELKIEKKQLIYLKDEKGMLQAGTGRFALRAEEKRNLLHGQAIKDEQPSFILTQESGIRPRFYVDLQKLTASIAPDVAVVMDTAVSAARLRTAGEVTRDEILMNKALQARRPQPDLQSLPGRADIGRDKTNAIDSEIAKSKQRRQQEEGRNSDQLASARLYGWNQVGKMPAFPGTQTKMPDTANLTMPSSQMPSTAKIDISSAERQMNAELNRSNQAPPAEMNLNAELKNAKDRSQITVSHAQPALDTILTRLHTIPAPRIPAATKSEPPHKEDSSTIVQWDKWHARFAELARGPILKAVNKAGNPPGANTVEIVVQANHKLSVRLTQAGKTPFDQAILQAYRSLDGNRSLEFPAGSRRSDITFTIDNKHTGSSAPSGVKSQTSVGDKEIVRHSR